MPTAKKRTDAEADTFTAEEKAAMREAARERRAARSGKVDGEADLLARIAEMTPTERAIAERLHALVKAIAPDLTPRTWYGMPAYARGAAVVCFFQPASKFKARYSTLGFNDAAHLDDGAIWPTSFAITEMNPAVEASITALVQQAVS